MKTTALQMFNQTIQYQGNDIWIKPVCDFFEINYENQTRKVKKDNILSKQSTKKSSSLMFSDNYPRILLTKKGFVRWIQLINPQTIKETLREKFSQFQDLVFDFLYGSVEDEAQTSFHYTRLRKLEKLYSKIGTEIKREKKALTKCLNGKYLQLSLNM